MESAATHEQLRRLQRNDVFFNFVTINCQNKGTDDLGDLGQSLTRSMDWGAIALQDGGRGDATAEDAVIQSRDGHMCLQLAEARGEHSSDGDRTTPKMGREGDRGVAHHPRSTRRTAERGEPSPRVDPHAECDRTWSGRVGQRDRRHRAIAAWKKDDGHDRRGPQPRAHGPHGQRQRRVHRSSVESDTIEREPRNEEQVCACATTSTSGGYRCTSTTTTRKGTLPSPSTRRRPDRRRQAPGQRARPTTARRDPKPTLNNTGHNYHRATPRRPGARL